jgi:hypothetical protein
MTAPGTVVTPLRPWRHTRATTTGGRSPGLTDVIYRCPSQFPPCLLQTLHASKKPARLHLQIFNLCSAYDDPPTIDPHEWDIITSPCLYSVWLLYTLVVLPSRRLNIVERMVGHEAPSHLSRRVCEKSG